MRKKEPINRLRAPNGIIEFLEVPSAKVAAQIPDFSKSRESKSCSRE